MGTEYLPGFDLHELENTWALEIRRKLDLLTSSSVEQRVLKCFSDVLGLLIDLEGKVLHLDIKPDNIRAVFENHSSGKKRTWNGRCVLIDFGQALVLEGKSEKQVQNRMKELEDNDCFARG